MIDETEQDSFQWRVLQKLPQGNDGLVAIACNIPDILSLP